MKRLAILVSFSGEGGVERVIKVLAGELCKHLEVDLLTLRFEGGHARDLPPGVRVIRLKRRHSRFAVGEIAAYLEATRPDVLLAAKDRAGRAALRAARRVADAPPVWVQLHTDLSASLAGHRWRRALRVWPMRREYANAAGVITVSEGVREDILNVTGLPPERVFTIHNPAVHDDMFELARAPSPHPWLDERDVPVIIGMGRLTEQKDFGTLIRAVAALPASQPARLVILGEGHERSALERLAANEGIADRTLLPGFDSNPYRWLARASVFALSSRWEGFALALAEAMAFGVPCVATDCPSGPREVLGNGRYGKLVPVGDVAKLSTAILAMLNAPPSPDLLRDAARRFDVTRTAERYLQTLGLSEPRETRAETAAPGAPADSD
jgi:glycosyltransferase involved in cell wall biosynthesis